MTSTNPEDYPTPREETLKERSERLEAEAAMGKIGDSLSPEPISEVDESQGAPASADNDEIDALKNELAETREKMLRAVAETDNIRKRAVREREDASKFAVSSFAQDMLSVSDNLRRAIEAVPDNLKSDEHVKALVDGVEATERELLRCFEKHKIETLDPLGQMFDPNVHEVMFETPGTGQPAGTVIQVVQIGYVIHGRLLRPARVGVAKDDDAAMAGGTVDTEV